MHDLVVLIVNWNVRELLRGCLNSVLSDLTSSGLHAKVWAVDNASTDGSPEMLRADFPQVCLVASQENLGFAGGNNLALRQIDATDPPRHALLLNPDTKVHPGTLRTLYDFMENNPQVGVAGVRLYYGDKSFQHSAFGFPGLWQILFDLYPLPGRLYQSRLNGRYPRRWYERGEPFPVDHPLGAAMMVRWQVIRQVGFFDQDFHMYCEEIDWCIRIKQCGWKIYCVPRAEITHYEGQSARQIRAESVVNLWRSRRRFYEKHYNPIKNWLAKRLVRVGMRVKIRMTHRAAQRGELDQSDAKTLIQAYGSALTHFD